MTSNSKVKLYPPLLLGMEEALTQIFLEGRKSDQVIPEILKSNPKWGSRDRNFVAENCYEMVRNRRLIEHVVQSSEIRSLMGAWLIMKGFSIEGNSFFPELDAVSILDRSQTNNPVLKYAIHPDLYALMVNELGEERCHQELEAMATPASVYLRVNLSKVSREKAMADLAKNQIDAEAVENVPAAIVLKKRVNLSQLEAFKKGWFEVQDAGSQIIVDFLDPQPGEVVIDACAGAGGKTLHIADKLNHKGHIVSTDVEEIKLKELIKRAQRNRFFNIETGVIDNDLTFELAGKADRLLLDVPCSGLGTIKRNPDAKEKLTPAFIEEIKDVQASILENYTRMLKSGGYCVYATCSLLPSENRKQVDNFLAKNTHFTFIKDQQIWPSETGFDGFYMALLHKQ